MLIILGLPFLIHNDIITDHAERSCVDKKTSYNFLNPAPISPPPPPHMRAKEQIKFTKAAKKKVLTELTEVCRKRIAENKLTFKEVKDIDVIAAIRDAIEIIALKDQLEKHGDDIKKDFRPIFEPIPHVDDLPRDYMARIKLKEAERTIINRTYPCPRKYKEAFQMLIQQHLDAGWIQLSSSAYASPCFIIPKSDPMVLPRWVNDFRLLNEITVPDNHPPVLYSKGLLTPIFFIRP